MFVIVLTIGYSAGTRFVLETTKGTPDGIEVNYNGNEDQEDADEMVFKKSKREILSIIHSHLLTISVIFLILAILIYGCPIHPTLKYFLMLEPFISLMTTFGGIYFLWEGVTGFKYIIAISGLLMNLSFFLSSVILLYYLFKRS